MQSLTRLAIFLTLAWALTLLYGELLTFSIIPSLSCSWPTSVDSNQVKVAVIADPQLMDRTSLNLDPMSVALGAAEFYTDIYMRRAFRMSVLPFRPDVIVFLGDQFDGGPALNDEEYGMIQMTLWKSLLDICISKFVDSKIGSVIYSIVDHLE